MNKDMLKEMLDERKKEISSEKNRISKSNKLFKGFNKFSRAFFGITGSLLVIGGMPGVGLAFLSTAIANHLSIGYREKETASKLAQLSNEENHIKNYNSESFDGSRETNAKRTRKVNELETRKENSKRKRDSAIFGTFLANAFQALGLIATVCVPSVAWISGLSLAAKYYNSKRREETAEIDNKLALRINNLNLDLEIAKGKAKTPRLANESKNEEIIGKAHDRVMTPKKEVKKYSEADERLVDEYIRSLENAPENVVAKQYRK